MRVSVQFFSSLKDIAGADPLERDVAPGESASTLLTELYREMPELAKWDPHIRVAAGVEWVERDYVLREGDAISIMPPVQGG